MGMGVDVVKLEQRPWGVVVRERRRGGGRGAGCAAEARRGLGLFE